MNEQKADMRRKILHSLTDLVDQSAAALGESEVAELLWEFIVDLDSAGYRHTCDFSEESDEPVMTLCYPTAFSLERDIKKLVEVRGLMVDVEPSPPLMKELVVRVTGRGVDGESEVRLSGRVVHESNSGVAVELFPSNDSQKKKLTALGEKMRQLPDAGPSQQAAFATTEDAEKENSEQIQTSSGPPPVDQLIKCPKSSKQTWDLRSGAIEDMLFVAAAVEGYGLLQFSSPTETRQYVIHYGRLIDVRSDPVDDSDELLIQKLISTGHINAEDVERADVLAAIHGITKQDALVDLGCITLEQLLDAIKGCLVDEIHQMWTHDANEASLYLLAHRPPLRLRRSSACFVQVVINRLQQRLAKLSKDQLEDKESQFSGCRLQFQCPKNIETARLGLTEKEHRFVTVILSKPQSLSELRRMSNLRYDKTLQMLLLFDELGLIKRHQPSTRLPEHSEIEGLYQRLAKNDHFEVLGIHWSSGATEVERAYLELREKLDVPQVVEDDLGEKLNRLRSRVSAAHNILSRRDQRRSYRDDRIDEFAQKSVLQVYEEKADSCRMRQDKDKLIDCLRRILELNPQDTKSRHELHALEQMAD